MIEGIFFVIELLVMLLLLLKITKKSPTESEESLGIFDYIKERPQDTQLKPGGRPRA